MNTDFDSRYERPIVGAVRWDAWIGDLPCSDAGTDDVGLQVERSLGPRQFHDRLPFFAWITGHDSVEARELTQDVMDAQILLIRTLCGWATSLRGLTEALRRSTQ